MTIYPGFRILWLVAILTAFLSSLWILYGPKARRETSPVTMAPTTTTTLANASEAFEPIIPDPNMISWRGYIPSFPDYKLLDGSAPRYKLKASLNSLESPSEAVVSWDDVPAKIHAIYFIYDRARFQLFKDKEYSAELAESRVRFNDEKRTFGSFGLEERFYLYIFDLTTNPNNPVEAAIKIAAIPSDYKMATMLKFSMTFFLDEGADYRSILDAASFFYVDDNGKANFLTNATTFSVR